LLIFAIESATSAARRETLLPLTGTKDVQRRFPGEVDLRAARDDNRQRTFEGRGDPRDLFMKSALRRLRPGNAENEQAIALVNFPGNS
jgi:hypothetical protein